MKKLLLFSAVLLQIKLYGQAVPNGTFENWNPTAYNDPTGYNSGNVRDIQNLGIVSTTKVTGYAGSAVRIQTFIANDDTSESYIINTPNPCNDPSQWTGGIPYSQQPTAITGYYRYNLVGNDTALLFFVFRKNGVHIGDNFIKIRGTGSQSTWTSFSFPLVCTGTPDTMILGATSSNKKGVGTQNGSFLELDNLAFTGTTQQISNGDFENWIANAFDVPAGWTGQSGGNGITKSSSSYSGSYAVSLETLLDECGDAEPSVITTGHETSNSGPAGGLPYTKTIDTLCGYYKYAPMGNDTAQIGITLTKNSNSVGGAWQNLTAASNYTFFRIPFNAFTTPDSIRIDIQSSNWSATSANASSILYVDNLYLSSNPSGVNEILLREINVFPNPVKDILTIQFEKNLELMTAFIYDEMGREVCVNNISAYNKMLQMDVENLPAGIYYYEIITKEGIARNKFVKE